jgi:hypothetical protein
MNLQKGTCSIESVDSSALEDHKVVAPTTMFSFTIVVGHVSDNRQAYETPYAFY